MAALFRSQAINLHVTLDLLCSTYAWTEYNLCDQNCTAFSVQQEQDAFQARQLPSFLSLVFHVRHYFLFEADTLYALLNIDCCSPQLAGINAAIKKKKKKKKWPMKKAAMSFTFKHRLQNLQRILWWRDAQLKNN